MNLVIRVVLIKGEEVNVSERGHTKNNLVLSVIEIYLGHKKPTISLSYVEY